MSTLEDYAVARIRELEAKIRSLNKEIAELNENIEEEKDETVNEMGTFYEIYRAYYGELNEIMAQNDMNPDELRKCLINPEALDKLIECTWRNGWGAVHSVGEIEERTYTSYVCYGKHIAVIIFNPDMNQRFELREIDNKKAFLTRRAAVEEMKIMVRKEIETYFEKEYNKQFKPKNGENGEE